MTPFRRELMFKVMDGQKDVLPYLHHFTFYHQCDEILRWFIKNNLIGKEFLAWTRNKFGISMLDVSKYVLNRLTKDESRLVLYGRDFL